MKPRILEWEHAVERRRICSIEGCNARGLWQAMMRVHGHRVLTYAPISEPFCATHRDMMNVRYKNRRLEFHPC